jgi:hypothetical protein
MGSEGTHYREALPIFHQFLEQKAGVICINKKVAVLVNRIIWMQRTTRVWLNGRKALIEQLKNQFDK